MATYEITSPDGQRFEITAPDDATQEQVLAYAQANFAQTQQERQSRIDAQIAADRELYSPTAGMSGAEKFLAGAGRSFTETGQGLAQLVGMGPSEAEVSERRRLDEPLMSTGAGQAGSIASSVLQGLALPGGQYIQGAKLMPALLAGAAQGAALSGAQAVGEGDSRIQNALTGGAFGAGGVGLVRGLGRVFDPLGVRNAAALEQQAVQSAAKAPQAGMSADEIISGVTMSATPARREAAAKVLEQAGIVPTLGQRTGAKPIQTLESVLAEMPATSAKVQAQRAAQQSGFNQQIAKFLGEQGDEISEGTIDSVLRRGNELYDKVGKSTVVKIDDDALNAIEDVWQQASLSLKTEEKTLFQAAIDRLLGANVKGGMPGEEFIKVRSQLSKASTSSDAPFAGAMRGLREVLDDALERSAGKETAAALTKARQQMRLALVLRDSGAASEGAASVRKVAGAVERANRKGKMPGDVKEFVRAASELLPDRVPNSGTAQRLMMQNMLTGQAMPGALGLGAGLLTGDPITGIAAAGAAYGGPRALLALMNSGAGGRYLAGELAPQLPLWLSEASKRSLGLLPLAATESQ
jgi:hypothetical protein